jgi:ABC-2 type transport system permease protein
MVNAFRYGLHGVSDIPVGIAFGIIAIFILVLGAFSLHLLRRGVGIKT